MVDIQTCRQMLLSFPEAIELPHFDRASFRVNKKIFATMDEKNNIAVLMLSEMDQSIFCSYDKTIFYPVNGTWGKQGATIVELKNVGKKMLKEAMKTAYGKVVKK